MIFVTTMYKIISYLQGLLTPHPLLEFHTNLTPVNCVSVHKSEVDRYPQTEKNIYITIEVEYDIQ